MPPFLKKGIESGRTEGLSQVEQKKGIESGRTFDLGKGTDRIGAFSYSHEGMPESAQSEVAARPEAAEVPGKKDWNFPQLLTGEDWNFPQLLTGEEGMR
jgi:hypothetical protein